ncbi:reverse transcriptase domain-containing protein [Tanacetum coccineum]|uniref:Reverse transcriptase domain-containing protein n=1 Tax=Tanacetum coccineum TaxID=301880 RepID=A0ABQ5CTJ3_9ASTR
MNEAESRYTTTEKEMLAVVYAFEKFRSYLVMNKCTVYTVSIRPQVSLFKEDSKGRLLDGIARIVEGSAVLVFLSRVSHHQLHFRNPDILI